MKIVAACAVLLLTVTQANAGAISHACRKPPTSKPTAYCNCLEKAMKARLSNSEVKLAILALKGKFKTYNRKLEKLGSAKERNFKTRLAAAVKQCQ